MLLSAATILVLLILDKGLFACSVLTPEEIVDLMWTEEIRHLLLPRLSWLTDDQVREAHSYACGGSVIQDLGYYLFGSKTWAAEYSLADESYADLLADLSAGEFNQTSPQLRANILDFYSDLTLPIGTRKDAPRRQVLLADFDGLKAALQLPQVASTAAQ